MPYKFALDGQDYSDYAAGPVLYSMPGQPAFPIRLATDIFQRCQAQLQQYSRAAPYRVYDPCCGSAYLLVTLAYLHWPDIHEIIASDIDPNVIPLAERNLSLLTLSGVDARIAQLTDLYKQYGKLSHQQAMGSAQRLREQLLAHRADTQPLPSRLFIANALDKQSIHDQLPQGRVDLVITDLPYGQRTEWRELSTAPDATAPAWQLLETLRGVMAPQSIIALTTTKHQKIAHDAYRRVEHFQLGKREIFLFMPRG
jgi:23S rRNA (guanine2535-N1)-methyltransferase